MNSKIRYIENSLEISVKDVCKYLNEDLKLTDRQTFYLQWDFEFFCIKELSKQYRNGLIKNKVIIIDIDDMFVSWTIFDRLIQFLPPPKRMNVGKILEILDSLRNIRVNDIFTSISISKCKDSNTQIKIYGTR